MALDEAERQPEDAIFIIPVRLEVCTLPARLARYHAVDLFEPEGYAQLLRPLRLRADALPCGTDGP